MASPGNRDAQRKWLRWIAKNQSALDRCRLPERVYATEYDWIAFLEHGFSWLDDGGTAFELDWLKDDELLALREFLEAEAASEPPSERDWYVQFFGWMDEEAARRRTKK